MEKNKLPLPENEAGRLTALKSYDLFNSGEEKDFDAIASIASAICQTPISLITFIDDERQWFKSHVGTDLTENSRELSFCTHAIAGTDDVMIVPNAMLDQRFMHNPVITEAKLTFYAGVPLVNEEGFALGTLCVLDQKTHQLSEAQVDALKSLAKQVVDKIELRKKVVTLEKTNQELLNANVLIQKFASMAAHDIKNPLSSIKLTSQALKVRHEKLQDEGCLRLVNLNIAATDNLLFLVDEMLAYSKNPAMLLERKQDFNLNALISKVLSLLVIPEGMQITLPAEQHNLRFSIIAVEQILINLLSNAVRYNDKAEGRIEVRFNEDEQFYYFEVEDNGRGIAESYLEKIFDNNFTLQVTDRFNNQGSGIGLATVKDLLTALGGTIDVRSVPNVGTVFYIKLNK